jgi:hypothetical protein
MSKNFRPNLQHKDKSLFSYCQILFQKTFIKQKNPIFSNRVSDILCNLLTYQFRLMILYHYLYFLMKIPNLYLSLSSFALFSYLFCLLYSIFFQKFNVNVYIYKKSSFLVIFVFSYIFYSFPVRFFVCSVFSFTISLTIVSPIPTEIFISVSFILVCIWFHNY